jgi:hypothetical protein
MLRHYAASAGAGLVLAGFAYFRAAPRARESIAALSADVCFAMGALSLAGMLANGLVASGVARWKVAVMLLVVALAPGALLYVSPLVGAVTFGLLAPMVLLRCVAPAGESKHLR